MKKLKQLIVIAESLKYVFKNSTYAHESVFNELHKCSVGDNT